MQVILKQRDIEQALKQYIAGQGINLKGKTVNIAFTAGRKETGISAELDIDDISGYIPAAEDLTKDEPVQETAQVDGTQEVVTESADAVESPFAEAVEAAPDESAEASATKSSSLFA